VTMRVGPVSGRTRVGVVGVGAIAAAVVEAILTGPRGGDVEVVLSPRSPARVRDLDARFASVRLADDNQAVLDGSDVVVLAVLPRQVADVCAALSFRPGHVVASLAAGWPPSLLREHVAPATTLCQLIPLPMIAMHTGPIVMFPEVPTVTAVLEGCGEVVVLDDESDVLVLSCASASMSTYFQLQTTLVGWATTQGLRRELAADYVAALFQGLAAEGATVPVDRLGSLAVEHETPGGLNEQVRRALTDAGLFAELTHQLDDLYRTRVAPSD
jgi:pyrroline-5-carboxylate reductase